MNSRFSLSFFIKLCFLISSLLVLSCKSEADNVDITSERVEAKKEFKPFFKLSLAQWSLHRSILEDKSMSAMDFAKVAKEMDFTGLEYVSQLYSSQIENLGMQTVLDSLLSESKKHELQNVLIMVDGEGDLANPSEEVRNKAVDQHKKWVDAANYLGCHSIRVNTFGSKIPQEWHNAVVDGLTKLSEYAATKNINVLVENHGWLSSDADKLMDAIYAVDMENCGTLPDFGNFCVKRKEGARWGECEEEYKDIYLGVKKMMDKAKAVSAKSYDFNQSGNETKLNYPRLVQIVKDAGYTGYIGVEYEGKRMSEREGIIATKNLLLKAAQSSTKN